MRRLALVLTLLATPALGDACADQFRAGMAAGTAVEVRLRGVEARLYSGLEWISRSSVVQSLENRSARTTACQEIAALQGELAEAQRYQERAESSFRLATSLCWDSNRTRALHNLDALQDSARTIRDLTDYLASLTPEC